MTRAHLKRSSREPSARTTYRDSPHYREAQRRLTLKQRAHTELGRYWHQRQFIDALRALLGEPRK